MSLQRESNVSPLHMHGIEGIALVTRPSCEMAIPEQRLL